MPVVAEVGEIVQTSGEATFEWKITDFFSLSNRGIDDWYRSNVFSFADSSWYWELFPNVWFLDPSASSLDIYIHRKDSCAPKTVYYTFGIKTSHGVEKKKEVKDKLPRGECTGSNRAIWWAREELEIRRFVLMPNNVLTITCDLRMDAPTALKDYSDSSTQTDINLEVEVLSEVKQSSEKLGTQELKESLKRLLAGGDDSDCAIKVRGKEFPVHRAVMRARSPVFRAMFAHDTLERQSNVVTIEDCDPETFPAFLEHVYTGSVEIISRNNVFGLYEASEKYDLPALKRACSDFVKQNLAVASFCEAITLAVKYNDEELVQAATEFYCGNTLDIVKTAEWQIFLAENPTVGNELYIKQLTK